VEWSWVKVLGTVCLSFLEDIQITWSFINHLVLLCNIVYMVVCFVCSCLIWFIMYSYCYVCSVPGILFHCVVLCIVYVQRCTVLLPLGVNPIAVIKYNHIIYHIILPLYNWGISTYVIGTLTEKTIPQIYHCRFYGIFWEIFDVACISTESVNS
jgi:hypothetical protein